MPKDSDSGAIFEGRIKLCLKFLLSLYRTLGPLLWWRMWDGGRRHHQDLKFDTGRLKLQVSGGEEERMGKAGELELLSSLQEINHFLHV